jgi:hypothetical protein
MEADPTSDLARPGIMVANRYRLEAVVGRGGMGSVWSAVHVGLGHRVAIKLISREFVRSPEALRRFDAEAKAAAGLQSRHVVQVYDNGTLDDGTPYIAMELLSGESLQSRIDNRGRLERRESVEILAQCCKALSRAHSCGIVHRDIKPENIFLARMPDEDGDVAKILDFGVAKVLQGREGEQGATGTGTLLGTPLFMSPEQVRGLKSVDARADVYSLGLTAYAMLTGVLAIDAETFGDVLLKICVEPLPSLRAVAPWLSPAMERWFQRVCAREPAERCQSAQEFIDTLRVAAQEAASPAGRSTEPSGPPNVARPGVAPTLIASGVNMTITAAGVPRRPLGPWIAVGALGALAALVVALLVAMRPKVNDAPATDVGLSDGHAAGALASSAAHTRAFAPAVSNAENESAVPASASGAPMPPLARPSSPVAPHSPLAPQAHEVVAVQPQAAPRPTIVPAPVAAPATIPRTRADSPSTALVNLGY